MPSAILDHSKSLWVFYFCLKSSWVIKTSYVGGPSIQNPIYCDYHHSVESLVSSLLNINCPQNWYQSKSDYMDWAKELLLFKKTYFHCPVQWKKIEFVESVCNHFFVLIQNSKNLALPPAMTGPKKPAGSLRVNWKYVMPKHPTDPNHFDMALLDK